MLQDDVIFCSCGHIHVVSGKDYSDAIEAGKENLLICGNCGATYISGAEEVEGGYSLYRHEIPQNLMTSENNYSTDLTDYLKRFYKVNYSVGYGVPMISGYFADEFFCGRFRDSTHDDDQQVDMSRFLQITPDHVLKMISQYHIRAFNWSNTKYERKTV